EIEGVKRTVCKKWCYYPIQPLTESYQLVLSLRALVEKDSDLGLKKVTVHRSIVRVYCSPKLLFIAYCSSIKKLLFFELLFMASGGSDRDALSKLLKMGTVAEYESEFEILINRVTRICETLLKMFCISGLKPTLQCVLLRSNPTTLGEAFSLARATEAHFTDLQLWELLRLNPTTMREAFSLARITEACFEDQWSSFFSNKTSSNNSGLQNQNLTTSRFTMPRQEPVDEAVFVKVNDETKGFSLAKSIEENNAFDATSSYQPAARLEVNKVVNDGDGEVNMLN
ncbi:hypothetical protein Tco_0984420, partial [Tanacetum coccineum]